MAASWAAPPVGGGSPSAAAAAAGGGLRPAFAFVRGGVVHFGPLCVASTWATELGKDLSGSIFDTMVLIILVHPGGFDENINFLGLRLTEGRLSSSCP